LRDPHGIAGHSPQFGFAARQVCEADFTGVTSHAAHGYLISQFLSPLTNRRQDKLGGSLENRAQLRILP
jgi:2,4-dienoyl-CoA reductase-like NADH-dependent reductase (Old Yellow Enzyme family)